MNAYLQRFLAAPSPAPCVVTVDGFHKVGADDDDDEAVLASFGSPPIEPEERAAVAEHYAAWRKAADERVWFLKQQLVATECISGRPGKRGT